MNYVSPINTGIIASQPEAIPGQHTLVVTGIARSGTTMVASILREAGLFMGDQLLDVVQEDAQTLAVLKSGNAWLLRALIERRNLDHDVWGFKIPNLHAHMLAAQIGWLRNPRLIVIFRDPVAVAVRNALSEQHEQVSDLIASTHALVSMAHFVDAARCPTLYLSYEKALAFPDQMVDSVLSFCGVQPQRVARQAMIKAVHPNHPDYLATANRRFSGYIEGAVDGQIYGWCHQEGTMAPVWLELYVDDSLVATFAADQYREDLESSGIGNGNHGFVVDVASHATGADPMIRVKVRNRVFELENSGMPLSALPAPFRDPRSAPPPVSPAFAPATAPILAKARSSPERASRAKALLGLS